MCEGEVRMWALCPKLDLCCSWCPGLVVIYLHFCYVGFVWVSVRDVRAIDTEQTLMMLAFVS